MDFLPVGTDNRDEIRELTPEEIASVEPVFASQGASLPDPKTSTFVGAIRDGKVVGFLVLQLTLHAEPMWIEEGHSDLFTGIVREAENTILRKCGPAWVYLFAPAGRITQLAQTMGMMQEPYCIMSKLVQPTLPTKPVVELRSDSEVPVTQEEMEQYPGEMIQ